VNPRRVLGTAGLVLLAIGGLDIVAGLGYARFAPRAPLAPASDVIALTFYTQNPRFSLPARVVFQPSAAAPPQPEFTFEGAPRWVERGVLAFDRDPGTCLNEFGKQLHVFPIEAQARRFFAIGFFFWHDRERHTKIGCALGPNHLRYYQYHPESFAPFDAVARRSRLEYAAHAELRNPPRATYPAHDKTMLPIPLQP
jgi:hypothetical protein